MSDVDRVTIRPAATVYREEQYFDWRLYALIALVGLVTGIGLLRGRVWSAEVALGLVIGVAFLMFVVVFILHMITEVSPTGVRISFGWAPGYPRIVAIHTIRSVEVVNYSPHRRLRILGSSSRPRRRESVYRPRHARRSPRADRRHQGLDRQPATEASLQCSITHCGLECDAPSPEASRAGIRRSRRTVQGKLSREIDHELDIIRLQVIDRKSMNEPVSLVQTKSHAIVVLVRNNTVAVQRLHDELRGTISDFQVFVGPEVLMAVSIADQAMRNAAPGGLRRSSNCQPPRVTTQHTRCSVRRPRVGFHQFHREDRRPNRNETRGDPAVWSFQAD